MHPIKLSLKQYLWLNSRGGRGLEDVFKFKNRYVVHIGDRIVKVPVDYNIVYRRTEDGYIIMK